METKSLVKTCDGIRVSSVLNRDTKQYGRKFLYDGNPDTCWNSDKGKVQWIKLLFDDPLEIHVLKNLSLHLQFQGGFCSRHCEITAVNENGTKVGIANCYPEDVNKEQTFALSFNVDENLVCSPHGISELKISFEELTDFFGRVTLYLIDILVQIDQS
uniref:Nuclear receptor 2C2-associated protein-like n=1 Tax=Phallusia mammillata TaxID=59560 RepID=A0A6F9DN82_9ASCI|nr:nuclear receptor 2C2-associated protein-like [Phallusia mammillata]